MSVCHPPPVANQKADAARGVDAEPHVRVRVRTAPAAICRSSTPTAGRSSISTGRPAATVACRSARCPSRSPRPSDGCRLVSANRGSCNLSLVDPSTLLAPVFAAQYDNAGAGALVNVPSGNGIQTIVPRIGGRHAAGRRRPTRRCSCPRTLAEQQPVLAHGDRPATPWRALVTFPSCDLVAIVDLPSGKIVTRRRSWWTATPSRLRTRRGIAAVPCPTAARVAAIGRRTQGVPEAARADPDAGGGGADAAAPTADAGAAGVPRPTAIAITPKADHAYVSLANVRRSFLSCLPTR